MLGFHPIAALPLVAVYAPAAVIPPTPGAGGSTATAGGGGGGWGPIPAYEVVRIKRRIQRTHIIRVGEWPEGEFPEPEPYEFDPLDMREILAAQPRAVPTPHKDGDDEDALIALLGLAD